MAASEETATLISRKLVPHDKQNTRKHDDSYTNFSEIYFIGFKFRKLSLFYGTDKGKSGMK